jgi:hypothetical protein
LALLSIVVYNCCNDDDDDDVSTRCDCNATCCWLLNCARPPAVLHDSCQAGQHTPIVAECQEPVHVPVLVALATGITGAAHAAPGHASSRNTSITTLLWAGLRVVVLEKAHVLRRGERQGSQAPSPNHQRHAQPCNLMLSLKAQQPG